MPMGFYLGLFAAALAPTLLFVLWLRRQPWELKEKISAWDPFIKILAVVGAIIVGLATFDRFLDQRLQEQLKARIERNEKRAGVYSEAIRAASTIATASTLKGATESGAVASFWRLYWGELGQFEGRTVEGAMVRFGRLLQSWQQDGHRPPEMEMLSLELARACRVELSVFDQERSDLENRYKFFLRQVGESTAR